MQNLISLSSMEKENKYCKKNGRDKILEKNIGSTFLIHPKALK